MDPRLKLILIGDPEEVLLLLVRLKNQNVITPFCQVITQFGDVITCRVKRKHLLEVYNSPDTFSVKAPRLIPALLQKENIESLSKPIFANPSRRFKIPYTGKGIYFAAIDWGFDFAHSNLRNPDGSTRFKCIWDQNGPYDSNVYGYGCFYFQEQINQALQTDTPYQTLGYHPGTTDILGAGMHGTHVIDIATGTPIVGEGGVAPQATYIGVQLGNNFVNGSDLALGDSVRLVEGLNFIRNATQDAPCVINMSLGSHGDSHTGKSLVEIAIDNFLTTDNGYAIVQSVGNYYIANCHLEYTIKENETYNIEWNIPRRNPSPNEVEIWYSGSDKFSLRLIASDGEIVADVEPFEDIQISYRNNPIGYIFHRSKEPNTGLNHIDIILDVSILKGKWIIQVTGTKITDGSFNAYCERNDASQAKFSPHQSSPNTTTGSVCNGKQTITVGAYDHNDRLKPVVRFSSSGPTATGQNKPDLLAPGYKILAARSAPAASPQPTNGLTVKSGSSMAAPHVAGSLVLLFQKCLPERLNVEKTKQLLFKSLDPLPAHFHALDHIRAGNGFLNIKQLLDKTQNSNMDASYITRPVRRLQDNAEAEDFGGEQEYHAPYLHENCQQCDDALLESIDEGSLEYEPELLSAMNATYFNEEDVNPFDIYRHFHPQYQFDYTPYKNRFTPIALPGKRLANNFQTGDIVLVRLVLPGKTYQAIITNPKLLRNEGLNGYSSNSDKSGYFVQAYGNTGVNRNEKSYLRITDSNNIIPDNVIILRANRSLSEDTAEMDVSEDVADYREYKLQYVKYGKGGGYMYAGDKSINYEEIFRNSSLSDFESKMAKHFLETEGGIDSINTYDNQIITWGFGFAGKSGNLTIALFDLLSANASAKNDFNSFGINLTSPSKNNLSISSDTQVYNGDDALNFWKLSKKYLNILISLTRKYAQDTFLAQWRTFKKIHRQVFAAFEDSSFLGNITTELEKIKAKTAVLHAHHHYPGFNPPRSFKDASSFEEVLRIYVNQSSKYGSVQGHANAWRISINRIFSKNAPIPPLPVPPPVPVPPVPNTSTTVLSGSVGKGGQNIPVDVTKVQQLLNGAGIIIPVTGQIDNKEGDVTILAIYHYQKRKKLPAYDGRVDVNGSTIKSLLKDVGNNANNFRLTEENEIEGNVNPSKQIDVSTKEYIKWVQASLNEIQQANLKVDGIAGAKTNAAVRTFQKNNRSTFNGIKDPQFQAALIKAGATSNLNKSSLQNNIFPEKNPCAVLFKNMYENDIINEANKEKYNYKLTDKPGSKFELEKQSNILEDYLIYDFDIDSFLLKDEHVSLINTLWENMYKKAMELESERKTDVAFEIKIEGFASRTYKSSAKHNCLLSFMRAVSTKDGFETAKRRRSLNVTYKLYYFGYFETTKEGEWDQGRSVRITIGEPGFRQLPPVIQDPGLATKFQLRCIELKDWNIATIGEEILDKMLERIFPNGSDYEEIIKIIIKKFVTNERLQKIVEDKIGDLLKKFPKLDKSTKRKALKEIFKRLKELQKFFPGELSIRTGRFEIKTEDAKINQIAIFDYLGCYLQLREIPIPNSPETGPVWSEFKIKSTNTNKRVYKEFKLTLRNLAGSISVYVGSLDPRVFNKGNLSFKNRNPYFTIGQFHETDPEPIPFKLPSDETDLRFSPSEGNLTLLSVK